MIYRDLTIKRSVLILSTLIIILCSCTPPVKTLISGSPIIAPAEVPASFEIRIFNKVSNINVENVTYTWDADGGEIYGEGESARWFAPFKPGKYQISVRTVDVDGHESVSKTEIKVLDFPKYEFDSYPNIIWEFPLLGSRSLSSQRLVRPVVTSDIESIMPFGASPNCTYSWSCNGGALMGTGIKEGKANRVGWVSPGVPGNYTLTEVIRSSNGEIYTGNMFIKVQNPSCGEGCVCAPK